MNATDSTFKNALCKLLTEIFDGPPGKEAYLLNPGDLGLLRQLDSIDAATASKRPMPGKTTIAAHVDHVHYGFTLMNRWAAGEVNPWADADWNASWQRNNRNRRSVAIPARQSSSPGHNLARGRCRPHRLGRHDGCRCAFQRRPYRISHGGDSANCCGDGMTEKLPCPTAMKRFVGSPAPSKERSIRQVLRRSRGRHIEANRESNR